VEPIMLLLDQIRRAVEDLNKEKAEKERQGFHDDFGVHLLAFAKNLEDVHSRVCVPCLRSRGTTN
jgi:hypothetical protein